jgi:DNA-binding transcriptional MerR regulator
MTNPQERLATGREVAAYLRVTIRTLNRWARTGTGPPVAQTLPGGERRYNWDDVYDFAPIDATDRASTP